MASMAQPIEPIILVPGRLVFSSRPKPPVTDTTGDTVYFCTDNELVYEHFFADFGPLNLGRLYRFCERLHRMLQDPANAGKAIHYYSATDPHKRANSAFLVGGFCIVCLGWDASKAFTPFLGVYPPFIPFRDAAFGLCSYTITLLDCFRALEKACLHKFFDYASFNIEEYETLENIQNGDLNWLVPGKFIAFSGPLDEPKKLQKGGQTFTPQDYVPVFKKHNVTMVVRLNKPMYNRNAFLSAGIKHADMFYPDGGNPPDHILKRFIELAENEPGAIGVHCKAGLGRTGTCIGAYVMKHYKFTSREVIAWFRICRPGSIIGPQQHYLDGMQERIWKSGQAVRRARGMPTARPPPPVVLAPPTSAAAGAHQPPKPRPAVLVDEISSPQHRAAGGSIRRPSGGGSQAANAGAGAGAGAGSGGGVTSIAATGGSGGTPA